VVNRVREKGPSLVIFDLNSVKMKAPEVIRIMKADPALQSIRTLGYVSHVDAETIESARQAGVDRVMARSAFADRLGEILTSV
jgi:CheY-like chemotaxis protein